jgi:hypothetical protein
MLSFLEASSHLIEPIHPIRVGLTVDAVSPIGLNVYIGYHAEH